jgi:hypothetical protein
MELCYCGQHITIFCIEVEIVATNRDESAGPELLALLATVDRIDSRHLAHGAVQSARAGLAELVPIYRLLFGQVFAQQLVWRGEAEPRYGAVHGDALPEPNDRSPV